MATNVTYRGMAMYQCYAGFKFTTGKPIESIACTQDGVWSATPKCEGTILKKSWLFFMKIRNILHQIKMPFNFLGLLKISFGIEGKKSGKKYYLLPHISKKNN